MKGGFAVKYPRSSLQLSTQARNEIAGEVGQMANARAMQRQGAGLAERNKRKELATKDIDTMEMMRPRESVHTNGEAFTSSRGKKMTKASAVADMVSDLTGGAMSRVVGAGRAGAGRAGAGVTGAGVAGAGRKMSDKMKRRSALVKQLMSEHGMSMIQASKYIKSSGLAY